VIDGLGKIAGRWAVVIGFDNKTMAGAWLAGQSENILRVTDLAKRLNLPLIWLVNCSGAKLPEQEKFYANRRGSRHAFLPTCRTGPGRYPGSGRHLRHQPGRRRLPGDQSRRCSSPTKTAISPWAAAGIVSGMAPRGHF
jgi:glutaconyl-CoA decarboxylase